MANGRAPRLLAAICCSLLAACLWRGALGTRDEWKLPRLDISKVQQLRKLLQGPEAAPCERFPYMASIRDTNSVHQCSGVLVKSVASTKKKEPPFVITSAHCLDELGHSPIVVIGACDPDTEELLLPARTFVHEGWTGNFDDGNDIALLWMGVKLTKHEAIGLPVRPEIPKEGEVFGALGWAQESDGTPLDTLQIALDTEFLPNGECAEDDVWGDRIKDTMMCFSGGISDADGCPGDGGGPVLRLFSPNGDYTGGQPSLDTLFGLASFGEPDVTCAEAKRPGVYTSVANHIAWITEKMLTVCSDCPLSSPDVVTAGTVTPVTPPATTEAPPSPTPTEPEEPPVELPEEPPVEPPTEPPEEPPVEPPTEPPVEPPTEPPVEPPTEPPVEPPTEPPVEPPVELPAGTTVDDALSSDPCRYDDDAGECRANALINVPDSSIIRTLLTLLGCLDSTSQSACEAEELCTWDVDEGACQTDILLALKDCTLPVWSAFLRSIGCASFGTEEKCVSLPGCLWDSNVCIPDEDAQSEALFNPEITAGLSIFAECGETSAADCEDDGECSLGDDGNCVYTGLTDFSPWIREDTPFCNYFKAFLGCREADAPDCPSGCRVNTGDSGDFCSETEEAIVEGTFDDDPAAKAVMEKALETCPSISSQSECTSLTEQDL